MERNFEKSLTAVLKHEGGYVDHPKDPGGATNKGITIATFRRYVKPNASKRDLKNITKAQVESVYRQHYWDKVRASELPSGVDYAVFDFAVNSGPSRAVKYLQKVVGATEDGKLGPATLQAVSEGNPEQIIEKLCANRLAFLRRLGTWGTFGKGWSRRVEGVLKLALSMAEDKPDQSTPTFPIDSNITYVNQNAIRNRPITTRLEGNISDAVRAVYGESHRAEIYSGGQPRKGTSTKRTGSIRHDDYGKGGRAADIRVYDAENRLVTGLELAKLGQYWLAKGLGCCGLEMRGGGIHLDEWTTPPKGGGKFWTYKYSDQKPYGKDLRKALQKGAEGHSPKLTPTTQKPESLLSGLVRLFMALFGRKNP